MLPFLYYPLSLDFLTIKAVIIQLIDAIAQSEAKLRIPMIIDAFRLGASEHCPNMEVGPVVSTNINKARVALKGLKKLFPLFTL